MRRRGANMRAAAHASPPSPPLAPAQLMNEELLPTLKLLEKQCAQYHEYAVTSQAYERLKRFCVAHEFHMCQR